MRHCFDSLFGSTPSGVLLINNSLVIEKANKAAGKLLGYSPAELISRSVEHLVFRETYEDSRSLQKSCSNVRNTTIELEKRLIRRDKSLVWVHFCLHSGYDAHTNAWYGIIMLTDISERKEMEAKLKKVLQKQEGVIQQIHQQVKHNLALLQIAGNLPGKSLGGYAGEIALANSFIKGAKVMPWVYSSLYVRKKTSGIALHKHLESLVGQLMLPYDTGYSGHKVSLAIEPVYVNAQQVNILSFIVHELLEKALSLENDLRIKLSFGNIRGTYDYWFTCQCLTSSPFTSNDFLQSVELASMMAECLQGEATLNHSLEGNTTLQIHFQDFARYTGHNSFAYHAVTGR